MADIRLDYTEAEEGRLPHVCMKCGVETTEDEEVTKTFNWKPGWINITILVALLVYIILAAVMTKRMTVIVPMCRAHKGHWMKRQLLIWGGFLGWLAFFIGSIAVASSMEERGPDDYFIIAMLISAGLFVLWLIVAVVATNTGIRPTEITDDEITLTGLSDEFVAAVREMRGRRRRRRRRDDDYDDDYDDEYDD